MSVPKNNSEYVSGFQLPSISARAVQLQQLHWQGSVLSPLLRISRRQSGAGVTDATINPVPFSLQTVATPPHDTVHNGRQ